MTDRESGGTLKSQFGAGVAFQNPGTKMRERKEKTNVQSDTKLSCFALPSERAKQLSEMCSEAESDDTPHTPPLLPGGDND